MTSAQRYNKELHKIFDDYRLHRQDLEKQALMTVSSDLYYDLADTIDSVTDNQLYDIIECGGDYRKEVKLV